MKNLPFFLMILLIVGCGYGFHPQPLLYPQGTKVYIPVVNNYTTERTLTNLLTEALRDRFEKFGLFTVVTELSDADYVLNVTLQKIRQLAKSSTSQDTAVQFETFLDIDYDFTKSSGEIIVTEKNFKISGSETNITREGVIASSADFADQNLSSGDLSSLSSRELARGQGERAFIQLSENAARKIFTRSVGDDF